MERLPQLEQCLRLAYEGRDSAHPSGVALASYFSRAPTRGRRRADLEADLLFSSPVRARLNHPAALQLSLDAASFRNCPDARPKTPSPPANGWRKRRWPWATPKAAR